MRGVVNCKVGVAELEGETGSKCYSIVCEMSMNCSVCRCL